MIMSVDTDAYYPRIVATAKTFAAVLDSRIPPGTISAAQAQFIFGMAEANYGNRFTFSQNVIDYIGVANAIASLYFDASSAFAPSGGTSTGNAIIAPFAFSTVSPYPVQALSPGQIITRAAVSMATPFDDPAARISLGTTLNPNRIFASGEVDVQVLQQFENEVANLFTLADLLIITVSPASSTQGAGTLYYWIQ
jgi:hypothetical protein